MRKQKTENSKHKIPNSNNGITLIALVITIIVMLILVAVTISMAVNGGLFEYASNAGAQTNAAIANEQELANLEADMTVDQLIDKYTESSGGIKAPDIVGNESTYYGTVVTNYTLPTTNTESITWKIFHSDGQNIYLIADDYVQKAPNIEGMNYNTSMDGVIGGYSNDTDGYIISKSSFAYKWIGNDFSKSTYDNMKAVAYMLDTNQWNSLYKGDYADYAIGGPTLKMFADSYNIIHDNDIFYDEKTEYGYKVKLGNGEYGEECSGLGNNDLYIKNSSVAPWVNGMWLACPATVNESDKGLQIVRPDGRLAPNYYTSSKFGFRPIICLNCNVALEEVVDGDIVTYKIME